MFQERLGTLRSIIGALDGRKRLSKLTEGIKFTEGIEPPETSRRLIKVRNQD